MNYKFVTVLVSANERSSMADVPLRLVVEPHIENWVDFSDPHYDFRAGYIVKYKDAQGWHEMFYGSTESVTTWLAERDYDQVSCTFRRHKMAGRYEHD